MLAMPCLAVNFPEHQTTAASCCEPRTVAELHFTLELSYFGSMLTILPVQFACCFQLFVFEFFSARGLDFPAIFAATFLETAGAVYLFF